MHHGLFSTLLIDYYYSISHVFSTREYETCRSVHGQNMALARVDHSFIKNIIVRFFCVSEKRGREPELYQNSVETARVIVSHLSLTRRLVKLNSLFL